MINALKKSISKATLRWTTASALLGKKSKSEGRLDSAKVKAIHEIKRYPDDPAPLVYYGDLLIIDTFFNICSLDRCRQAEKQFLMALELDANNTQAKEGLTRCNLIRAYKVTGAKQKPLLENAYAYGLESLDKNGQITKNVILTFSALNALSIYMPRRKANIEIKYALEFIKSKKSRVAHSHDRDCLVVLLELNQIIRTQNGTFDVLSSMCKRIEKCASRYMGLEWGNTLLSSMDKETYSNLLLIWVMCLLEMSKVTPEGEAKKRCLGNAERKAYACISLMGETSCTLGNYAMVLYEQSKLGNDELEDTKHKEIWELIDQITALGEPNTLYLASLLSRMGSHDKAMDELRRMANTNNLYPLDTVVFCESFSAVRAREDYKEFVAQQLERLGKEWAA